MLPVGWPHRRAPPWGQSVVVVGGRGHREAHRMGRPAAGTCEEVCAARYLVATDRRCPKTRWRSGPNFPWILSWIIFILKPKSILYSRHFFKKAKFTMNPWNIRPKLGISYIVRPLNQFHLKYQEHLGSWIESWIFYHYSILTVPFYVEKAFRLLLGQLCYCVLVLLLLCYCCCVIVILPILKFQSSVSSIFLERPFTLLNF